MLYWRKVDIVLIFSCRFLEDIDLEVMWMSLLTSLYNLYFSYFF